MSQPDRICRRDRPNRIRWAMVLPALAFGAALAARLCGTAGAETQRRIAEPPFARSVDAASDLIRVGVRRDAEPFSYRRHARATSPLLPGYGGYIVEICRTVLEQMTDDDVFAGFSVRPVVVTAANRFDKLRDREVDVLCGPESITVERLRRYNVSHPVFLSGIARVKLPTERMPRSRWCGPILGLVEGTTSEQAGVRAMSREGHFGRFDPAIRQYLAAKADQPMRHYPRNLLTRWQGFVERLEPSPVVVSSHAGRDDLDPQSIRTGECPSGYRSGPVVTYDSHAAGLADLCAGEILYYLGDVDIVKRNLDPRCDDLEIGRRTFTREAYGIHFRKPPRTRFDELDADDRFDAVLYAEFNHLLVLQMQSAERLLENQYREEFGDAEMASDLASFFENLQYVTDY